MEWLCRDVPEKTVEKKFASQNPDMKLEVSVRTWTRAKGTGAPWELYLAKGPLEDIMPPLVVDKDDHCLWFRCWPNMDWGLGSFLQTRKVPPERRWSFDTKLKQVDSTME